MSTARVCLIGAGPSGMSFLYQLNRLITEGKEVPEVTCFEKQAEWGGLWNYTWRTGLDAEGEPVHGSMYRNMWSNGPKEGIEYPDYTFEDHFGKAIPSYPPREVLYDYLVGRWKKEDLKHYIRFNHIVRDVRYNEETDNFSVVVKNRSENRVLAAQTFDYVVVASGHFSTPNVPYFPGVENFPGRVLHSHDFRDSREFKGKRVLVVGSSLSAEDIALQVIKYGATSAICTYRTKPMGFKWPSQIEERPLLQKIVGNTCHFKDGSTADVDAIIFCTGYLHTYNFMADDLRLMCPSVLYPPHLYKGTLWLKAGNSKCLYVGAQDQCYTYTMFDAQARWAIKYIVGDIGVPEKRDMEKDTEKWIARNQCIRDIHGAIDFQTDFVIDLAKESDYGYELDVSDMFHAWMGHKEEDILTYRDRSFASKFTGTKSPVHHSSFMSALNDSMTEFLAAEREKINGTAVSKKPKRCVAIVPSR